MTKSGRKLSATCRVALISVFLYQKITVRMKIDKWRRKRELKKLMKKLEAGFPDMDEKLPDEEMPDFCSSFEGEEESVYELAATVASFTAERAADHFTDVVDGMRMDTLTEMLRMIRHGNPESGLRRRYL